MKCPFCLRKIPVFKNVCIQKKSYNFIDIEIILVINWTFNTIDHHLMALTMSHQFSWYGTLRSIEYSYSHLVFLSIAFLHVKVRQERSVQYEPILVSITAQTNSNDLGSDPCHFLKSDITLFKSNWSLFDTVHIVNTTINCVCFVPFKVYFVTHTLRYFFVIED